MQWPLGSAFLECLRSESLHLTVDAERLSLALSLVKRQALPTFQENTWGL
jgi:hypothetical protein